MRPEYQVDTMYINQGDDYEFYITPSYSIASYAFSGAIASVSAPTVVVTNWGITKDLANNRVYFKLLDNQTSALAVGQYIYDVKETNNAADPPFDNHPLWGYIMIESTIT